jgi:acyl dehydratase
MTQQLYLEDIFVGQRFAGGPLTVDPQAVHAFAEQFDPQPFHLDEKAAAGTLFGSVVASGWHTASLTMRMLVDNLPFAGGTVGTRAEIRWPCPVNPGDKLHIDVEVVDARPSAHRPEFGVVKMLVHTRNQHNQLVMEMTTLVLVRRRAVVAPTEEKNPSAQEARSATPVFPTAVIK